MRKGNYHQLAQYLAPDRIDPEVTEKLNLIVKVQQDAKPYVG
jgi:hypothetical protein